MSVLFCTQCGTQNNTVAKFCSNCGQAIVTQSQAGKASSQAAAGVNPPPLNSPPKDIPPQSGPKVQPQTPPQAPPANARHQVPYTPKAKKKRRGGRIVLRVFIILFLLVGGAWFAFDRLVDPDVKREFYKESGLEGTGVADTDMEAFINAYVISKREKLLENAWVINGTLKNTHTSKSVNTVVLQFQFSDGNSEVTISKYLGAEGIGAPFRKKVSGHKGASFYRVKVIDAY